MNLMVGESHVGYIFDPASQAQATSNRRLDTEDWTGFCYSKGRTIFSVANTLEEDLAQAGINPSAYDSIVFVFGTNDAILNRDDPAPIDSYAHKYIDYVEYIRNKYNIRKAYITTPWYPYSNLCSDWNDAFELGVFYNSTTATQLTQEVDRSILKAAEEKKYANVHVCSMLDLFSDGDTLFSGKFARDCLHFNDLGRQLFMDTLTQYIKGAK